MSRPKKDRNYYGVDQEAAVVIFLNAKTVAEKEKIYREYLQEPINKGFTYLSEQAFVIHSSQLKLAEIPITFVERVAGRSTVTWREVLTSLRGVLSLILLKKKIRINV